MKKITVFTPTYNRVKYIDRLYKSLLKQSYKNFEWLVVDDGSTDNTEEKYNEIKKQGLIDLTYIKVPNGGKHRAINVGIKKAKGELFFIVDSDDFLLPKSLEKIVEVEKTITKKCDLAGVVGLKGYSEYEITGTTFDGEYRDLLIFDRKKNSITGDKAEVFYTKILKKYSFPEYENENFVPEAVVWNKMAFDGYKLRYFNDIIYICEYLEDGLTKNIEKKYLNNPNGFYLYIQQLLKINEDNIFEKIKYASYYCKIMKNKYDLNEISKKLNLSKSFLRFSCFIRKVLGK